MYLLPWEDCGPNLVVRREGTNSMKVIVARIDFTAGRWVGKICWGVEGPRMDYKPSAMSFHKICSCSTKEEAIQKMDTDLVNRSCKFIDKKFLVMI